MPLDINSLQQSLAAINAFPAQVQQAGASLQSAYLGPWTASTNCTYGCNDKASYTYQVDFSGARGQLSNMSGSIGSSANGLKGELQAQIATLKNNHSTILNELQTLQSETQKPGLDNKPTVMAQLDTVIGQLNAMVSQLNARDANLASYGGQVDQVVGQLTSYVQGLQGNISSSIANISTQANGQKCGADTIRSQVVFYEITFVNTAQNLRGTMSTLGQQAIGVRNANGTMLGAFTSFIGTLNGTKSQLQLADTPDNYHRAISLLHIDVALGKWRELGQELAQLS